MKNTTTLKISKKYEAGIKLVEKDGEGYWAYAEEGYIFENTDCATIHEYTQADFMKAIRTLVKVETETLVQDKVENQEATTVEANEITFTVETKVTPKTTTYIHTIKQGETTLIRKSKKQYDYAIVCVSKETGKLSCVYGFRSGIINAENECDSWNTYFISERGINNGNSDNKAIIITR